MNINLVDPRTGGWEIDLPAYRVCFWSRPAATHRIDVDPDKLIYSARWFELTAVSNVREVLAWADENAAGRLYVVYAAVKRGDDAGLVRVFGIDPTKHKGDQTLDWPGQVYLEE